MSTEYERLPEWAVLEARLILDSLGYDRANESKLAAHLVAVVAEQKRQRPGRTVAERLWAKVDMSGGDDTCWPYIGALSTAGYGHFTVDKRYFNAHRIAYVLTHGPVPTGLVIDHLCRNPPCCNPAHLEAVTNRENLLRSPLGAGGRARRTHCPAGHEYTAENTEITKRNQRHCRTCRRARHREWSRARTASLRAVG